MIFELIRDLSLYKYRLAHKYRLAPFRLRSLSKCSMLDCFKGCLPWSLHAVAEMADAAKPPMPREAVTCSYGKASVVFPLSISAAPAEALLDSTKHAPAWPAEVRGYTTSLTTEAGACSVRVALETSDVLEQGNYAVALQAPGFSGWLPGLGNTRKLGSKCLGFEVVVLARADSLHSAVTYLAEDVLAALFPRGATARIRVLQPRLMKQLADCPGQWLRDRLLKLANCVEERHDLAEHFAGPRLQRELESAGLRFMRGAKGETVSHADRGQRISEAELGYWQEEADLGHRCAGSMEGHFS